MDERLKRTIQNTVLQLIKGSYSDSNILRLKKKHEGKVHIVPIRYRVFGGILQGLNIKFGNFIELLMRNIVSVDPGVSALEDSGKKVRLYMTSEADSLIDQYITMRQLLDSPDDCTPAFDQLLQQILEIEKAALDESRQGITKDIDGLFRTREGLIVYTELKYNDDHDTGKFVDINRKFIKTWAGLVTRLKIQSRDELLPILYYFNPTKRYGPIYTPSRNIMRGSQLFERFFQTRYEDVDHYLREISEDPEVVKTFDDLYNKIRFDQGDAKLFKKLAN